MKRASIYLAAMLILATPAAKADVDTASDENHGAFGVSAGQAEVESLPQVSAQSSIGTYHQELACDGVCSGMRTCADGTIQTHSWIELPDGSTINDSYWCPSAGETPAVSDSTVATAFRRIPLPPSSFQVQPPGGRTLVNFETNFFADTDRELDRTVRLLGQRVDLRIEAHSYTWHFDDGDSVTTTKPGAPYPRLQITHNYLSKGSYRPTLDITWVADYRVDGGPWRPVPGSVTIAGAPTPLRAVEARPTLVGYER